MRLRKKYVDDKPRGISRAIADTLYLRLGGGSLQGGLHFVNASKISNLTGGSLSGNLNLQNNRISGLVSPTGAAGATNCGWVESYATGTFLPLAGGTLTGELSVGNNRVTNLGSPTDDSDAVSKSWVENNSTGLSQVNADAHYVKKSGDFLEWSHFHAWKYD